VPAGISTGLGCCYVLFYHWLFVLFSWGTSAYRNSECKWTYICGCFRRGNLPFFDCRKQYSVDNLFDCFINCICSLLLWLTCFLVDFILIYRCLLSDVGLSSIMNGRAQCTHNPLPFLHNICRPLFPPICSPVLSLCVVLRECPPISRSSANLFLTH
jgi:hypothetical protein